jgi:thymidine phosphorylase
VTAGKSGYVAQVDPMAIARAALLLGAGRVNVSATVDHAVGVTGLAKIGERVHRNDRLCTVHANDSGLLDAAVQLVKTAFTINTRSPALPALIGPLIKQSGHAA